MFIDQFIYDLRDNCCWSECDDNNFGYCIFCDYTAGAMSMTKFSIIVPGLETQGFSLSEDGAKAPRLICGTTYVALRWT